MHIQWNRIGFKPGSRLARIRGDFIGAGELYSFDPWRNMLILSSFEIKESNAMKYLDLLNRYKIEYINAYPSSIFNLIQLSGLNRINIPSLKAVFLGSENILEYQVGRIKEFFGIKTVYYWYGHGELCCLGGTCEQTNNYHFFPSYGLTEFIKNSDTSNRTNNFVEIVGTSFINPAMPLIRYKTSDYGIENKSTCMCGRNHKLLSKVLGREQEIAVGFNGERITLTALIFGRHSEYFKHVIKLQIINTMPGYLVVNVIKKDSYTLDHETEIVNNLSSIEGMPFNTKVNYVSKIESTKSGKHRLLIREFDNE